MDIRTYPNGTANRNVPKNAFLMAETSTMSGEIVTTYYVDEAGDMFKVTDWTSDKPSPVFFSEVCRVTGDTPNMISARWAASTREN